MKKIILSAFAALALLASPAYAETAIGVVNLAKIMKESKATTSIRSQMQAKQKAFQNELDAKEKALQAEDQSLVKQRETMDKATFEKKVKEFREKAAAEDRAVRTKRANLEKAYSGGLEEIQKTTQDIVKQVAAEKKLNLVLSAAAALHADSSLDVTDEVLKRLDAKLPNVSLKF